MEPTLSIIIPVFNVAQYLSICIESVINQSYSDYEIILVNDGSTDDSGIICDEYSMKYKNIKVIHKTNGGLSDARNYGITQANGKYLIFLDSDDFWENESLNKIMFEIQKSNEVDLCFLSRSKYLGENNKKEFINYDSQKYNSKNYIDVLELLSLENKLQVSACTKIINREIIVKNNLVFEKGLLNEDIDFFFNLMLYVKDIVVIDVPFYNYRANRIGSITNSIGEKNIRDRYNIIIKWIDIVEKKFINERIKLYYYRMIGYEYEVLLGSIDFLEKNTRNIYLELLREIRWIYKYRKNRRSRCINVIINAIGLGNTSKLLNIYLRLRR